MGEHQRTQWWFQLTSHCRPRGPSSVIVGMMMQQQQPGSSDVECVEWQYEMRRVMQEIVPRLFLGPYAASKKMSALRAHNITHILVVRSAKERIISPAYPNDFAYYILEIPDSPTASLLPYLPEVLQFIDAGRASGGILLHCDSGIS